MCGLVGAAGDLHQKHEEVFRDMLVFDSVRGYHSTGVAFVSGDAAINVTKAVGSPFALMHRGDFKQQFFKKLRVLLGHNRYATVGHVSEENAHPFLYGNIVGAHNGTLTNKYILEDGLRFQVDSQALINHINVHGVESAVKNLSGAWAITFFDSEKNTINFLRNKERPLYYAFTKDKKVIFWASEKWMIDASCSRNKVEIGHIVSLKEDTLISYGFEKGGALGGVTSKECRSFWKQPEFSRHIEDNWYEVYKQQQGGYQQHQQPPFNHKPDATVTRISSGSDVNHPLLGAKSRTVNVIGNGVENSGGKYLLLSDPEFPTAYIRLYLHARDDEREYFGEELMVDLHDKMYMNSSTQVPYFKALYSTHLILVADDKMVTDHNGNLITKEAFIEEYGSKCSWCDSDVDPTEGGYLVNSSKTLLCKGCVKDPEVKQYLN